MSKQDCPNCMNVLRLCAIEEDFMSDEKVYVYRCGNDDCDNEHDNYYHIVNGEIYDGKPSAGKENEK